MYIIYVWCTNRLYAASSKSLTCATLICFLPVTGEQPEAWTLYLVKTVEVFYWMSRIYFAIFYTPKSSYVMEKESPNSSFWINSSFCLTLRLTPFIFSPPSLEAMIAYFSYSLSMVCCWSELVIWNQTIQAVSLRAVGFKYVIWMSPSTHNGSLCICKTAASVRPNEMH